MNRTPRLSKSGIEYLDYVWNFSSGCTHGCSYCWARSITERFPDHYPNGFKPTVYPEAFLSPVHLKKPSIIGCVFMGDLFDDSLHPHKLIQSRLPSDIGTIAMSLKGWITTTIKQCPQHTFVFLTKQPQNLAKWNPFPGNAWVGVSVTKDDDAELPQALASLSSIEATIKYISFEPLLGRISFDMPSLLKYSGLNWVIIGAQTSPKKMPAWDWVKEILNACDKAGVAVFLKNNLGLPRLNFEGAYPFYKPIASGTRELRQELPNE